MKLSMNSPQEIGIYAHVFYYDRLAVQIRRDYNHSVNRNCENIQRNYAYLRVITTKKSKLRAQYEQMHRNLRSIFCCRSIGPHRITHYSEIFLSILFIKSKTCKYVSNNLLVSTSDKPKTKDTYLDQSTRKQ